MEFVEMVGQAHLIATALTSLIMVRIICVK